MTRVILATALSLALASTSLVWAAPGQTRPAPDPKIGTRVTITGCLHEGTARDSFVLLGVTERPADESAPVLPVPWAIYWLDSTAGLKDLVGELVDITGRITERRAKPGTITIHLDPAASRETDVAVRSGGDTVTSEKFDAMPKPAGEPGAPSSLAIARPVYTLVVENVSAVNIPSPGPACR